MILFHIERLHAFQAEVSRCCRCCTMQVVKKYFYFISKLVEKPAEAGGAPLGGCLKLCEGDTRIPRIGRAVIIIDINGECYK